MAVGYSLGAIVGVVASIVLLRGAIESKGYELNTPHIDKMIQNVPFVQKKEQSGFHIY